jgi:dTDP-4-amino-4,6-dideoxygalactose transaminase
MKNMEIPFHRAAVGEEEAQAVAEVIRGGWMTMGPKTFEFEKEFAKYLGVDHAIAVSTGTAALHLALEASGVRAGDEVILPTTTFTATAEAVSYLGALPVLADIDPVTMNVDVADASRRITPRTKAIIPVHLAGLPCEMDDILNLAGRHHLRVIEDAAHALPSEYRGKRIGQISEFACFSFYATKTLTTGEGGMVTTGNAEAANRIRLMRLHGIERDFQSAMGLVQLAKCDAMRDARGAVARRYSEAFSRIDSLVIPTVPGDRATSWHLYILRIRDGIPGFNRDDFLEELRHRGIGCSVHFIPLHLHPFYQRAYGYRAGDFPNAESQFQSCLSLPIYPGMTDDEIQHVIRSVQGTAEAFNTLRSQTTQRSVAD